MSEEELFKKWQGNVCCLKRAHFDAANFFGSCNGWLGGALIFFSASASAMAYLENKLHWVDGWLSAIVPVLGLITTLLAGLQTYFRFSERSERHRSAGTYFAKLEMELQALLVPAVSAKDDLNANLADIKSRWVRTTIGAPLIPKFLHRRHCGHLEHECC